MPITAFISDRLVKEIYDINRCQFAEKIFGFALKIQNTLQIKRKQ